MEQRPNRATNQDSLGATTTDQYASSLVAGDRSLVLRPVPNWEPFQWSNMDPSHRATHSDAATPRSHRTHRHRVARPVRSRSVYVRPLTALAGPFRLLKQINICRNTFRYERTRRRLLGHDEGSRRNRRRSFAYLLIFLSSLIIRYCVLLPPPNLFFFPSCISCSQPIRFAIIFSLVYPSLFSIGLSLETNILLCRNPIKAENCPH